jgi:predicted nucleic acid-binding Zn ribbon protein
MRRRKQREKIAFMLAGATIVLGVKPKTKE